MAEIKKAKRVVNLAEYVPDFLKGVEEFQQVFQTEQAELGRLYETMDGLWTDSFLKEAGLTGIKRYESLLKIRPYPGDSLEERRAAALLKWNQQLPYTLPRLVERLDAAVGRDFYELYVQHKAYELELLLIDQTYRVLQSVRGVVREMIPANLLFIFIGKYPVEIPVETTTASRLELASDFYARYNREYLYLDGTWPLDGTYLLNGYKEIESMDLYPSRLTVAGGYDVPCHAETGQTTQASIRASPETETAVRIQGGAAVHTASDNRLAVTGTADAGPDTSSHLQVENDLWYLDGTYLLDGTKLLDAEIFDYDL